MDIVLVDEHEALREGVEALLGRHGIRTIGSVGTAAGARELMARLQPDVAVIALRLPDESGLRLVRRLHRERPDLAMLIYTGVDDLATLAEGLESGARGFLLKLGGITQLVLALRAVARGGRFVDPAILALLDAGPDGPALLLTTRERDVYDLLAQGLTGEEIATQLLVAPATVRTHVRNGMEKLNAHTRSGAVAQALKTHEIKH